MVDEHLNHCGNKQHMSDAEVLDCLRHGFGCECLDNCIGAGVQQHAVHSAPIREVEHRCRMEIDRVPRKRALCQALKRVEHEVAVAQHDSLGASSRAPGVED